MTTEDPTPDELPERMELSDLERESVAQAINGLRSMGQEDTATELETFIRMAEAGELTRTEGERRLNALMASVLGVIPGDFAPALATDPDEFLQALTGEAVQAPAPDLIPPMGPEAVDGFVAPAPPLAGAQLAQALAQAGLDGKYVVLTPAEALDLADVAAFAAYAREAVYPVIVALQPLVQRLGTMGDQLQSAGPASIASLLMGSFGSKS